MATSVNITTNVIIHHHYGQQKSVFWLSTPIFHGNLIVKIHNGTDMFDSILF
jgi:hypothetical protein